MARFKIISSTTSAAKGLGRIVSTFRQRWHAAGIAADLIEQRTQKAKDDALHLNFGRHRLF